MKTLFVRRAATAVALVAGITAMTTESAQAVVRDTDYVKIAIFLGKADFGSGGHLWGDPQGNGVLTWDESTVSGVVTGNLRGRVYWDDGSGGCARVRIQLYNTAGNLLGTATSGTACRVGGFKGSVPYREVNISRGSTAAHKMVITTQKAASETSPFYNEASVTRYWGQVNGVD